MLNKLMDISMIITGAWCLCTLFVAFYDGHLIKILNDADLQTNRRKVESFSTNLSIMGVLGTFIGITWGLLAFDSENLDDSVPRLLDGLKFAFLTSIFGMFSSSIINKMANKRFDRLGETDITTAATNLSKTVESLRSSIEDNNAKTLETAMTQIADTFKTEMSKVSAEMTKLMKTLVDKNFNELNSSINNLNTWQQENKNVMEKMSETSSKILSDLGMASYTLKEVADSVERLTAPCGFLSELVADLHKAMSDDYNFVEISNNLSCACRDIDENVTAWGDVIRSLDKWLKTQEGYKNSIENLIVKLDELNTQRDYNEAFWQATRKGMEDATDVIGKASTKLKDELENIDKTFYERLNATLTNLDRCIANFRKG